MGLDLTELGENAVEMFESLDAEYGELPNEIGRAHV